MDQPSQDKIITDTNWAKSIRFVATPECNLHCSYCHREGHEQTGEILSTKKTLELLSFLSNSGVENIFIGGGELFLRDDIFEILDFVCTTFKRVRITSNGTCFPKRIPSWLSCIGNIELNISLNTLGRLSYERITGADLLGKVISRIQSARMQFKLVAINFVLFKRHGIDRDFQNVLQFCSKNKLALNILTLFGRVAPNIKFDAPYTFFRSICDLTGAAVSVDVYPYTQVLWENVSINVRDFIVTKSQPPCKFCNLRSSCEEGLYVPRLYWDGKFKTCLCREDNAIDLLSDLDNIHMNKHLHNFYPSITEWERRR